MKALSCILLLLVLALPIPFTSIMYCYQMFEAQEEADRLIMQSLCFDDLVEIVLTPANEHQISFSWWKEKEFEYNGRKYDIVKSDTITNGVIRYWCFDDSTETRLTHSLLKVLNHGHSSPMKQRSKHVFKLLVMKYVIPQNEQVIIPSSLVDVSTVLGLFISQDFFSILSPPPEGL